MEQVGFQCKVLYRDNDLVKVRISGWNGTFGGAADVYIGAGQLSEIALRLRGFPGNGADVREVMLGTFDSESAGGGVRMKFYCVSAAGHCRVEAKIAADPGPARVPRNVLCSCCRSKPLLSICSWRRLISWIKPLSQRPF